MKCRFYLVTHIMSCLYSTVSPLGPWLPPLGPWLVREGQTHWQGHQDQSKSVPMLLSGTVIKLCSMSRWFPLARFPFRGIVLYTSPKCRSMVVAGYASMHPGFITSMAVLLTRRRMAPCVIPCRQQD